MRSVGSGVDKDSTERIMIDFLRLGFVTLIHFQIENLFHNILKHLNVLPKKTGYWYLTDAILEQCSIKKSGYEKDVLTAFAYIRNSLHGNGIHRNPNLTRKIGGRELNFIKGKRIECATWEDIIVLLIANVEVLEKVLLSDKVINIKTEIKDDFASTAPPA